MSVRARCPRCHEPVRSGAAFCGACGALQGDQGGPAVEVDLFGGPTAPAAGDELVFETRGGRWGRAIGAAVAAALVVAVGVSVASGGGGGESGPTTTTVEAATTTTTTETTTWSAEATAPITTTTLGPVALGAGPLLGEPTSLTLLVTLGADLHAVDLDTGIAQPLNAGRMGNAGSAGMLTSVGLLLPDNGSGLLQLLRPGAKEAMPLVEQTRPSADQPFFGGYNYIGEGPPGRLWLTIYGPTPAQVGYVEPAIGPDVHPLGPAFAVGLMKADGLGGVVFSGPGGVYRLVPGETPTRLSTGYLQDAVNGHVLTVECDELLQCGLQVRDLRRGTSWSAPMADGDLTVPGVVPVLAPDGRHVVLSPFGGGVPLRSGEGTVRVVGDDGAMVTFRETVFGSGNCFNYGCQGAMVWSTDGSWLFGLQDSATLWAWRPGLDAPRTVELPGSIDGRLPTFSGFLAGGPTGSLPAAPGLP